MVQPSTAEALDRGGVGREWANGATSSMTISTTTTTTTRCRSWAKPYDMTNAAAMLRARHPSEERGGGSEEKSAHDTSGSYFRN